jgi:hypothetical protein
VALNRLRSHRHWFCSHGPWPSIGSTLLAQKRPTRGENRCRLDGGNTRNSASQAPRVLLQRNRRPPVFSCNAKLFVRFPTNESRFAPLSSSASSHANTVMQTQHLTKIRNLVPPSRGAHPRRRPVGSNCRLGAWRSGIIPESTLPRAEPQTPPRPIPGGVFLAHEGPETYPPVQSGRPRVSIAASLRAGWATKCRQNLDAPAPAFLGGM